MTRFGFAIDQRSCIGCHACTVACKEEHGVELGVFRTWVKYIEQGTYPDARRYFSVLRCNHCDDAPCVEICPTKALYTREDGIVDFDPQRCIGCKACMNACPYDALYIDPDSQTAAKCNFCAHRVEMDLKPSCEVVCPTEAIVSGDLDDPDSKLRRLIDTEASRVRAPEQGTRPKLYYVGAQEAAIDPIQVSGGDAYLMNELVESQREKLAPLAEEAKATAMADIAHPPPWGWRISSYFLSKGVAAGAMLLAVLLLVVGARGSALADIVPGSVALAGIAVTGGFLVWDLKQPRRFIYLFTKPHWRSWLTIGAQLINLAAVVAAVFTAASILAAGALRDALIWAMVPAAVMLAGYTGFLFNQCEGRDLWQSRLVFLHMVVNAVIAGAAVLSIARLFLTPPPAVDQALGWSLLLSVGASAAIIAVDLLSKHETAQAEQAARNLCKKLYARRFWIGGVCLGLVFPTIFSTVSLAAASPLLLAIGAAFALAGLWFYEDAWVRAGQSVPLS